MDLRRFFHGETPVPERPEPTPSATPAPEVSAAETATVRHIVDRLEALPPDQARYIACASYVVARAANADMDISEQETAYMEQALRDFAGLDESQAVLVVEMAKLQARAVGGTEDFLVTREFKEVSTPVQRLRVLRACLAVTAVDDSITASESAVVNEIANELDIEAADLAAVRAEFTDKFAAVRAMREMTGA